MSNGTLMPDMPTSNGAGSLAPAVKVETMVGAAERCSQAVGRPCASSAASMRSTDTVWR